MRLHPPKTSGTENTYMNPQQQRALARLRQIIDDPAADPAEIADCYVSVLGPQLQDFAGKAYTRDGRGVVEIDLRGIDLGIARGTTPITYFPADAGADDWPPDLIEILASYEPHRETIILLYQDRCDPLVYVLE